MNQVNTHIAHLPIAYQCAVEMLGASGDRTQERMQALCDHYASTYGLTASEHHAQWKHDAWCIAKRRYLIEDFAAPHYVDQEVIGDQVTRLPFQIRVF